MKSYGAIAAALAIAASAEPTRVRLDKRASAASSSLPTITQRGNAFWNGNERFYIRGIDYQPGGSSQLTDPLADPSTCERDIANFQKLGLNAIRVYTVDNTQNHDECMSALAAAGIYLLLDVNNPNYSLNRDSPGESYNPTYLQSVFAIIDAFAGYSNLLLFFSGNEVINDKSNTQAAPYVKAVNRDMKQYIGERGYRAIPVGYSAADVSQNQYQMGQYLNCGSEYEQADFYAINNYQWCDPSSFQTAWSGSVELYQNYSTPVFFSEYGCITNGRTFQESTALYQSDMTAVFSGGLVYEYAEEGNGYGIVNINGNKVTPVGQQFSDLQSALAAAPSQPSGPASLNNPAQPCPGQSQYWNTKPFTGSALPATPEGALDYFKNGAGPGKGLEGGSQTAPGGSTTTASAGAGAVTATYGSGASGSSDSSSSGNAAPSLLTGTMPLMPLVGCGVAVALSVAFGASLL